VEGISHLILSLGSLSHQKEYELFLKTSFRKADENKSGYLSFSEVIYFRTDSFLELTIFCQVHFGTNSPHSICTLDLDPAS
jgi:hypothetical protein